MNTIKVDILNPASLTLLKELEKLRLIAIRKEDTTKSSNGDFMNLVQKIRSKSENPPSLEEITAEVEQQRAEMYAVVS
jgi:hypothetical protein